MDEFQKIWSEHNASSSSENKLDTAALDEKLLSQSNAAFKKISQIMAFDVVSMILTSITFIGITFIIELDRRYEVSLMLFALMVVLGAHYWFKKRILNNHDYLNDNIATMMKQKLKYFKWNSNFYVWGIALFTSCLYVYLLSINPPISIFQSLGILAQILFGVALTVTMYWSAKWLHHLMYGKEIDLLEKLVEELNH